MLTSRRVLRGLTMALTLLLAGGLPGEAQDRKSDRLVIGWSTFGNEALSPVKLTTATQDLYLDALFDYLVYIRRNTAAFEVEPGLAQSHAETGGGRTWRFVLRDGVTFHNGDPVTAADVKFSFELYMSPASTAPRAGFLRSAIESIQAVDARTVVFALKSPVADFPMQISDLHSNPILPKRLIEQAGHDAFAQKPVGSGPYEFVAQKLGASITMKARPSHWRGTPTYRQLEFRLLEDRSTRLSALLSKEVDVIDLPLDLATQVAADEFEVVEVPFAINEWVNLGGLVPPGHPKHVRVPWQDRRVREAMSLAINREALVKGVYAGHARPAAVPFWLPGTFGFDDRLAVPRFDLDRAKALLKEAGFPDGFPLELYVFDLPPATQLPRMGEAIAQMWSNAGIKTSVVKTTFPNIRGKWAARDLATAAWTMRLAKFPDLTQTLPLFWKSDGGLPTANSAELDQQVAGIVGEPDPAKRVRLMSELVRMSHREILAIPVVYSSVLTAKAKGIAGWQVFPGLGYKISYAAIRPGP